LSLNMFIKENQKKMITLMQECKGDK